MTLSVRPSPPIHWGYFKHAAQHATVGAGIADAFHTVVTNGAFVDGAGRLRVTPYQPTDRKHSCTLCPPNLCKVRGRTHLKGIGRHRLLHERHRAPAGAVPC